MKQSDVIYPKEYSFVHKVVECKQFPSRWHYHKEYELMRIAAGHGKMFVGTCVENFIEGDVVLVGGYIPHFLMSDAIYYEANDMYCKSEVLQFTTDIFPAQMKSMPEFEQIHKMLEESTHGILFRGNDILREVSDEIKTMENTSGIAMLISLYRILNRLSTTTKKSLLSKDYLNKQDGDKFANTPINRTYDYLMNHFKENITLPEIAKYAGQNSSALCRNFKKSTGKNIFDVLIEIRIEFACKFLVNTDFSVTEIAFNSGFQNISHFNHTFKKQMTLSPLEYRKRMQQCSN